MTVGVGGMPRRRFCVAAGMWGAEKVAKVGGTPCCHVRAVAGMCRGQKRQQGWVVHLAVTFV